MKTIVFAGAGSMAEAIIQGWIKEGVVAPETIYVMNKSNKDKLTALSEQYGIQIVEDREAILKKADFLILAMKPKDIVEAMRTIAPHLNAQAAVLSVVAGTNIEKIQNILGAHPIARVMPNTSATIGMSASGIAFSPNIPLDLKATFKQMLEAIGVVIEVQENELHAITGLSGSGPAYIYYLIEAFEEVGMKHGLERATIRQLAIQTIAGAAEMLKQSSEEPTALRRKVTSPGGTTAAGIKALEEGHFKEAIAACVDAAAKRSVELASE